MTDIVARTRSLLYGHGIGEKPTIVVAPADTQSTSIGTTVTFTLGTKELAKVEPGDTLGVLNAATAGAAHSTYVLSKSTSTVTVLASYMGAPPVTGPADLDGAVFELNPLKSEHFLWQAAQTAIDTLLYPEIYKYKTYSVTPNLSDFQVPLDAAVEEIMNAYQIIGGQTINIGYNVQRKVHTSISATGVLGELFACDGSPVYITTRERYVNTDTFSAALAQCVATAAAAIAVGGARSSTDLESAKKDSQFRGERNPASELWRDFITLRSSIAADIAADVDWFEIVR